MCGRGAVTPRDRTGDWVSSGGAPLDTLAHARGALVMLVVARQPCGVEFLQVLPGHGGAVDRCNAVPAVGAHAIDNAAIEGIAAHWKYKEGRRGAAQDDQRITWLRQLVEWQREMHDPGEFMATLKVDLYPEEVYTFTPKGRVITLPRDATPIDFAYAIHSDIGNTCTGAKVNGRIVQLKYGLRNGDVVEILTQAGHLPSKDWLALVKTSRARNKIKHVINTTERVKAIEIGEKYLEREARRFGVALSRISAAQMSAVAADYGVSKIEDLHAALGYGKYSARQVLQKLAPDQVMPEAPAAPASAPPSGMAPGQQHSAGDQDLIIKVKGIDDLLVYRAKCCNPIRGEAIVAEVGAPNLKVQMDLYHCQIVEGDLAMHLRQFLPTGRVGHMQIAGVPERHEPDVGEVHYPYLFGLIDNLGYDGWIGCEYRPRRGSEAGGTSRGLGWLKPWL